MEIFTNLAQINTDYFNKKRVFNLAQIFKCAFFIELSEVVFGISARWCCESESMMIAPGALIRKFANYLKLKSR